MKIFYDLICVTGDIVFASGGGVGSVKKAVFVVSLLDEGVARAVLAVVFGVVDGAVDILKGHKNVF